MRNGHFEEMPLEEFERQAHAFIDYMPANEQVITLVHLIYHTLDSADLLREFIIGLGEMKRIDQAQQG
jgi:hypothetical protein